MQHEKLVIDSYEFLSYKNNLYMNNYYQVISTG
jgi:hypothetical protein